MTPADLDELEKGRQLLRRLVKYVREDRAVTPGKTRLARLTDQVDDYLQRTHDPRDILRGNEAEVAAPPGEQWIPVGERMPPTGLAVIISGGTGYFDGQVWRTTSGHHNAIEWEVTHWMPLPAPPKGTP